MSETRDPLNAEALELRMDVYLDAALSSRRTAAAPAHALAAFPRDQQELVLRWGAIIANSNSELAYQFTAYAPEALKLMEMEALEQWLLHAMDLYDYKGQLPAILAFQDVRGFACNRQARLAGVALDDVRGVLERFVLGLSGRGLKVAAAAQSYTDTETLFLPAVEGRLPVKEANFRLYKAMVVHQWAQNWYGTWRDGALLAALDRWGQPELALRHLHALETVRLDACIERDFPGLYRDVQAVRGELDLPAEPGWREFTGPLRRPAARLEDSLRLLDACPGHIWPRPYCDQGSLFPEQVRVVQQTRLARERNQFRIALAKLIEEVDGEPPGEEQVEAETLPETRARFALREKEAPDMPEGFTYDLFLDGKPVAPPEHLVSTMESIIQDLGEIPPDYLVAAGPGLYKGGLGGGRDPDSVWGGTYHEEGAFLYKEWDYERQHHRKNWCVLREQEVRPAGLAFYHRTLRKHGGLVKSLRRTFEVLRGEDRVLKRQRFGDDVDIDALVEAHADVRGGLEMSDRLFTRVARDERNIAVMLMVDMSGSTKGWVNEAEREAIILLAEALETLGDRYAIYGFSGWTRKRCETFVIKRFEDALDEAVKGRICGIEPRDYTRMGAPIRHLSARLREQDARIRLLVTLSDGKPDDYDPHYRGAYGIEDTRQALFEARLDGIHPFCITIDEQGAAYLPHLYGAANYVVVADVAKLPLRVSEIYRKLTS